MTVQQTFEVALRHHQSGELQQAEQIYRQILAQQPAHAGALHLLGVIAHQVGRNDAAVALIRQAIGINPNYPEAHNNLGNVLREAGQLDEAVAACQRAIALRSGYSEAHNNLGAALRDKGELGEAIVVFRRAIALNPNSSEALSNLGAALRDKGELEEALAACRQAIVFNPTRSEAHNNLGNVLRDKGELDEAVAAFRQAIALKPAYPEARNNLGNALRDKGQLDEAVTAFQQAISLKPEYPEAHNNLGVALSERGQWDEAVAAFGRAIALKPSYPEAHSNLGYALRGKGQLEEAITAIQQGISLKADHPEAYNNLGIVLSDRRQLDEAVMAFRRAIALNPRYSEAYNNLGIVLKDQGQLDEAIAAYRQALAFRPGYTVAHGNLVYTFHFHPAYDAEGLAEEHRRWNQRHGEPLRQFIRPHSNDRSPERRLRIGYVSPDFREHPVGRFILPLLAGHDHERFEIFAYAQVATPDALTQQIRGHVDHWKNLVGLSDEQAAQLVRDDQIDILVDLTMHMANNRLLVFARKPAPIQITYLAYCSTTGLSAIDYRLSDSYLDPPSQDPSIYSERTIHLPKTYWCYQPTSSPPVGPVPALSANHITFGSLNNFCKASEPALAAWARLLQAVPESQLLLHAHEGSHRQRTAELFQRLGVDPQRLRFIGHVPMTKYMGLYDQIDIALDPFPYGGGTTTCDALWMGVPVVSLAGRTAVGRGGVSILSNMGVPELVASTPEEYVQMAACLARDMPRLIELRRTLRERMEGSPVMDAPGFARDVELVYRRVWQSRCGSPG